MFDLHFHSTNSDGKLTVPELAEIIRKKKLTHCALTDHNSVDGIRELEHCLSGTATEVISGVELTAKYQDDEVHLLAYDFGVEEVRKILEERRIIIRKQKIREMAVSIQKFRNAGFEVTNNLQPNEKQAVGLTIVLDICAKRYNQELFFQRHGQALTPMELHLTYQAPGKVCAVERSGVTIEWLVDKFNGIAEDLIIAHPFVSVNDIVQPLGADRLDDVLKKGTIGIEVYQKETTPDQIETLKQIVKKRSLHYTGGSDFHGKEIKSSLGCYNGKNIIPEFRLTNYP